MINPQSEAVQHAVSTTDLRLHAASSWLTEGLRLPVLSIHPLAGDASFRRYFRVYLPDTCYILMDAPPDRENTHAFIAINGHLQTAHITSPNMIATNVREGFLLLEDFGDTLFSSHLNEDNADSRYHSALQTLVKIQHLGDLTEYPLPRFDKAMMLKEMHLFTEWFVIPTRQQPLSEGELTLIRQTFERIADKIEQFPYCFVHRDYHSRNLMILANQHIGVLDFQDAVWGSLTYDVVSLLKDCYLEWPRARVLHWLSEYHHMLMATDHFPQLSFDDLLTQFEWVGIQRHLKVMGIFSRLHLRDHKSAYLKHIPLTKRYLLDALSGIDELTAFGTWLETCTT